jgi:hypothetical protein
VGQIDLASGGERLLRVSNENGFGRHALWPGVYAPRDVEVRGECFVAGAA